METSQLLQLVKPNLEDKEKIIDFKNEFIVNREILHGTAGLIDSASIEDWLIAMERNSKQESVTEGLVPSSTYLAVRITDQKLVGMIDIRHRLNSFLMNFGGHIGYSIRKQERRKGYGKQMLKLALEYCKELGLENVLITCDKDNIGSANTILANNGRLENEIIDKNRITQRYWISIK